MKFPHPVQPHRFRPPTPEDKLRRIRRVLIWCDEGLLTRTEALERIRQIEGLR